MKRNLLIVALVMFAVHTAGAGNAYWELVQTADRAYAVTDGDWTFSASPSGNRLYNVDGSIRSSGPFGLAVAVCTGYPDEVTPLDFSKPIVNRLDNGREYGFNQYNTQLVTWEKYGSSRIFTATPAGMVAGKLTFPSGDHRVTINARAFGKCEHIDFDMANLPEGLTRLEDCSFAESDVHGELYNTNLVYFGAHAIAKDSRVTAFTAPRLQSVGECAFWASGVTNVDFVSSDALTSIGSSAFYQCTNLVSVTPFLPRSCMKVGRGAFSDCVKLSSPLVYYGGNNSQDCTDSSDWEIFHNCRSLPSADLSHSTLKFLTRQSFDNCYALEWVKLPDTFLSFGKVSVGNQNGPFANCTNLTTVTPFIPDSVTNVQNSTFSNCPKLRGHLKMLGVIDIGVSSINGSGIDTVEFGPRLKSIGGSAFLGCKNLVEIRSPETLGGVTVGAQAFKDCTSLEEADLRFVSAFANQVFYNDTGLRTVRFGEGLTAVGSQPFLNTPSLREIYWYGDKPDSLPDGMFQGCSARAVTNYVPKAYAAAWQSVVTDGGTLGRIPVEWRSNSSQWIRTWQPHPGIIMLLR